MKTPILNELYLTWRAKHSEQFSDVIECKRLQSIEDEIANDLSFLSKTQMNHLTEQIGELENKCCCMGYNDGFKMGCKLLVELLLIGMDKSDFLNEILGQGEKKR
ncbi:hypothetical protein [uncultured Lactobacillus sp.]|uniref:hypothetical protein n=1 Tax=uncultured Lactobacillus sp. TaxID=153152 RepID=UPI00262E0C26|nr:hypothetical protein [uncultured Lactobacillus sp.]